MASVQNIEVKVLAFATDTNDKGYGCDFQSDLENAHVFSGKNSKGKSWSYVTARVSIVHNKLNKLFEDINKSITKFQAKPKQSFSFDFDVNNVELAQGQNAQITNLFLNSAGEVQNLTDDIAIIPLESLVIGLASTCLKKETQIAKLACKFIETTDEGKVQTEGEWIVTFFNELQKLVKKQASVTQETV